MILQVYSVYDAGVAAHLQPFFARARGEAIRSFSDAVNDGKGPFGKHSIDFTLVFLGEFNDASGEFVCRPPERVLSANEVVEDRSPVTVGQAPLMMPPRG